MTAGAVATPAAPSRPAPPPVTFDFATLRFDGADLPRLHLSERDARLYRQILAVQRLGQWTEADRAIADLDDLRLLGVVRRERLLHPTAYRSRFDELFQWLQLYGDHPGADRIYRLAQRRRSAGEPAPPAPHRAIPLRGSLETEAMRAAVSVAPPGRARRPMAGGNSAAAQRIDRLLRDGKPGQALKLLGDAQFGGRLAPAEYDTLRSDVAAYFFFDGNLSSAQALARASAKRSGDRVPYAHWIAGLAAWRQGAAGDAARHFESMAANPGLPPRTAAAAAYWTGHSLDAAKRPVDAGTWFEAAARYSRTFYGLLAAHSLEAETGLRWALPELTARHVRHLMTVPGSERALLLLQVHEFDLAEEELRRIHPGDDALLAEALIALANEIGLPALGLQLGNALPTPDGNTYDGVLYPLPHWQPYNGFALDKALVFAFVRQESRFEPNAVSYRGATGLMQLMPATARYVLEEHDDLAETGLDRLVDPEINLALGQSYIQQLLRHHRISDNLIYLSAAYNAGPSNLTRWRQRLAGVDDPVTFIESIPFGQTRVFVKRILSNFWIYRMRLGQIPDSLAAIADGGWPLYRAVDSYTAQVADRG